jgi:arginyl-tRNA synthetase
MKQFQQRISPAQDVASIVCKAAREIIPTIENALVAESRRPDISDFQSNVALKLSKELKTGPKQLAQAIVEEIQKRGHVFSKITIDGPGFINFRLSPVYLARLCNDLLIDDRLGCSRVSPTRRVVVDFGGPNVAKSMHVGHLRSTVIGHSLRQLFLFAGYQAIGDVHLGDWGTQMGMLIHELHLGRPDLVYFEPKYQGPYPSSPPISLDDLETMYPEAAERCKNNPEDREAAREATVELQTGRPGYRALWVHFVQLSAQSLKEDFNFLGVSFDLWWGESTVDQLARSIIVRLQEQGVAESSEGAIVVRVEQPENTNEIPPLILEKVDGAVMYGTTDLATIEARIRELGADAIIYVVDQRQATHFEQVFRAAVRAGICERNQLEHIGFGTVNGPDGRPFKTRAGGVMKLKDLLRTAEAKARERINESRIAKNIDLLDDPELPRRIANAAIKFADLSNFRLSNYNFDLDRFVSFEGHTGPYILYSMVRIRSILDKMPRTTERPAEILSASSEVERELQFLLSRFAEHVKRSLDLRAPNVLCEYIFNLAQAFSRFYSNHHILSENDPSIQASRLSVSELTLRTLETAMGLLGIEPVERM